MFAQCIDPKALDGFAWMLCYLTSGTHRMFYLSFGEFIYYPPNPPPRAMSQWWTVNIDQSAAACRGTWTVFVKQIIFKSAASGSEKPYPGGFVACVDSGKHLSEGMGTGSASR